MARSFRDGIKLQSPPWLATGIGEKLMYTIGLMKDALMEKANQAVRARMPGQGTNTADPILGSDRLLSQGPHETAAAFEARLSQAFDAWQHAGAPRAKLGQLAAYVAPVAAWLIQVNNAAVWDWYAPTDAPGASPAEHYNNGTNWNWDGNTGARQWWQRIWVIIGAGVFASEGTWGDGQLYGDGGTWGTTATPGDVSAIRALVGLWKARHAITAWIIIRLDDTKMTPFGTSGNPTAGTWAHWGHDDGLGNYAPIREASARYWDGIA